MAKTSSLQISPHLQLGAGLGGWLSVYKGTMGLGIHFSAGEESEEVEGDLINEWDSQNNQYENYFINTNHSAMTIMGRYNQSIGSFTLAISAGMSFISQEEENTKDYHISEESTTQIYLSIGAGKKFSVMNLNIQPMIQGTMYNENIGVSALLKFNFIL